MDRKNRALLSHLSKNGRMTLTKLGKHLDMSHVAARKRLKTLGISASQTRRPRGRELVRIVPSLNVNSLDLHFVTVLMEVKGAKTIQNFSKMYKNCPRLVFFGESIGSYNLVTLWVGEDLKALQSMANACAIRNHEEIRKSEILLTASPDIPSHLPLKLIRDDIREETDKSPCGVDCRECDAYTDEKCPGCPATSSYKGNL